MASPWVINGESIKDFLQQAWQVSIRQQKSSDLSTKMNPHACTSHIMHDITNKLKKL